jgi:hypothetical protein
VASHDSKESGALRFWAVFAVSPSRWNMFFPVVCFCIARQMPTTCVNAKECFAENAASPLAVV